MYGDLMVSPEFGEARAGDRIAGRFQVSNKVGFTLVWMGGQLEAEYGGSVVPDRCVGRIFPVPMAQQPLANPAFADEKHFAFFIPKAVDALGIGSAIFNPRLAPAIVLTFDF
jgi:hypothetical protein